MNGLRIGSLCSGTGGLEMGLMSVVGGSVAWHVEYDKAPAKILAHHWPDVPNYGDITTTDWTQVEPVDWLTAGYPCQPFSISGMRRGKDDERHLWPYVAAAIGALRPRRVLLENVDGHVTLGLADVLADLAALGYDATWGVVRADEAGAPHGRARVFIVACDTNGVAREATRTCAGGCGALDEPATVERAVGSGRLHLASDSCCERHGARQDSRMVGRLDSEDAGEAQERERPREELGDRSLAVGADAACISRGSEDGDDIPARWQDSAWGGYQPAIERWAVITGRRPPEPADGDGLTPHFTEWVMGLPAGWVTDVPITRNEQHKALGNGVVPQQCALALRTLLPLTEVAA